MEAFDALNDIQLSSFWEIILGGVLAVLLVYAVELARTPAIRVEKAEDVPHRDGRKILKVKVTATPGLVPKRAFPWKQAITLARLQLEVPVGDATRSFTLKWDRAPEPWDYEKNMPKLELLPAAYAPENFIVGESVAAAVAIKRPGDSHFCAFDPKYYLSAPDVRVDVQRVEVVLKFRSAAVQKTKRFIISNGSTKVADFELQPPPRGRLGAWGRAQD